MRKTKTGKAQGVPQAFLLALLLFWPPAAGGQQKGALQPGRPAPPLGVEQWLQPVGRTLNGWEDLRGKVVVLEFWATWCGPCVGFIRHLNDLAQKFQGRVEFISISDENEPPVTKLLRVKPIEGWIGLDTNRSMFRDYGVGGIPQTMLVDASGILIAATYPEHVNETVLNEILAGNTEAVRAKLPPPFPPASIPLTRSDDDPPPLYEVLIRPAKPRGSMRFAPHQFVAQGITLEHAIISAYDVSPVRLIMPEALARTTYDFLIAVPLDRPPHRERALQLQHALETAFGLRARRETHELDAWALVAPTGRTPALREPAPDTGSSSRGGHGRYDAYNMPLRDLARLLESTLKRPVVDETGVEGKFDLSLSWNQEEPESVVAAVREQLGLELRPVKRPIELLIIEIPEPPSQP